MIELNVLTESKFIAVIIFYCDSHLRKILWHVINFENNSLWKEYHENNVRGLKN